MSGRSNGWSYSQVCAWENAVFIVLIGVGALLLPLFTSSPRPQVSNYSLLPQKAPAKAAVTWHKAQKSKKDEWSAFADYPQFHTGSATAKLANKELQSWAVKDVTDFANQWKNGIEKFVPDMTYAHESKATVSVNKPDLISLYFTTYEFTGGAHGNTFYTVMNYGIVNGKPRKLALKDIFLPGTDLIHTFDSIIVEDLRKKNASLVVDGELKNIDKRHLANWILTPSGITFLYEPYAVASYAEGVFMVKVPFEQLEGKLNLKVLGR